MVIFGHPLAGLAFWARDAAFSFWITRFLYFGHLYFRERGRHEQD